MLMKIKEKNKERISKCALKPKRASMTTDTTEKYICTHEIITNILKNKYCKNAHSQTSKITKLILKQKSCSTKIWLDDWNYDTIEEKLKKMHRKEQSNSHLRQLTQYYRYYTQTSVLFLGQFFISMYNYRQTRKQIDIKRIKILLQLSQTEEEEESTIKKSETCLKTETTFYILPLLKTNTKIDPFHKEESESMILFIRNLPGGFKKNRKSTIEEIDDDYSFLKKTAIDFSPKNEREFDYHEQFEQNKVGKQKQLFPNKMIESTHLPQKDRPGKYSSCQSKSRDTNVRVHRKNLQSMNDMNLIKQGKQNKGPTAFKRKDKIQMQIKLKVIDLKNKIKEEKEKIRLSEATPDKKTHKNVSKTVKIQHFTIRKLYASNFHRQVPR